MTSPATYQVQDASLKQSVALPANKSLTAVTSNIDLGPLTGISACLAECEALLTYPALVLAKLPNTSVISYAIEASDDPAFGGEPQMLGAAIQTGATATPSQPGGTIRAKLPTNCGRYLRAIAATDGNGADCSAVSMTLQLLF